jgi:2-oxoglutarate dehydrogenase E2 component (dihydrolipoamide succinyltransferase)
MPIDVVMPQMGESIFEGTITKWLKKVGDAVEKDEPLFEISTDKVDAEIPSTVAGILSEIKFPEGATVEVNTVVAVLAERDSMAKAAPTAEVPAAKSAAPKAAAAPAPQPKSHVPASEAPPVAVRATTDGIEIVMPQMGESIFEGTITKWLKKVGDTVEKDEPLFEISTDKVDAEIPSSVAGVLTEIRAAEGETVRINTVVAVIGGSSSGQSSLAQRSMESEKVQNTIAASGAPQAQLTPPQVVRSSPLVRKIAKEHNVDLRLVAGSGSGGRINKESTRCQSSGRAEGAVGRSADAPAEDAHSRGCAADEDAVDHCAADGGEQTHQSACALGLQGRYDADCAAA